MTLSEELSWRGFVNQTTFKDITELDKQKRTFYWGVDPSANSMQIGNFAAAMMARHFIDYGYTPILLVGGATGLIGDPDGKKVERDLKSVEEVETNVRGISDQFKRIFAGKSFDIVNNYDWFKDMNYMTFLREVGKHVPMRQMLGREFVQSRLGEDGAGISYAEFSYSLIQGYDFLHLYQAKDATLQLCGADQWGNSIAGVDLIRRIAGGEAHVWSTPLVINKSTGIKFGKSEAGAIWLDAEKTSPTEFYQFWINCDDLGVIDYMKIYTFLTQEEIETIKRQHEENPGLRFAQTRLAEEVTTLVHGKDLMLLAKKATDVLTGKVLLDDAEEVIENLRREIPFAKTHETGSIIAALVETGLAVSNGEARRLIQSNAISVNGDKIQRDNFQPSDFRRGRALIRRGKAYKDSAVLETV